MRAKADASECELKTTEMKKNIRLKTMRNARSAHMQIRAIRPNLPKVSIYQKPIVKMQTEAERERVEKRAHKMGENEAVQVMEQVSGFDSVSKRKKYIDGIGRIAHSFVGELFWHSHFKQIHTFEFIVCSFFFVFAARFGLAHFALRININVYAGFVLLDQKDF